MPVRNLAVDVMASPALTASRIAKRHWVKMVAKNDDLHGNVPDECLAALLIIFDVSGPLFYALPTFSGESHDEYILANRLALRLCPVGQPG